MRSAFLAFPALVLAGLATPGAAHAAPTGCPALFAGGAAPDLTRPALAQSTREICRSAFAVLHSGLTRTPLWSAERLTRDGVRAARGTDRVNAFHPEPSLPSGERAELSDYVRSGYDRGHMAPSGDMPDPASQEESFSLANMVPQDPDNNRGLWASIETAVRDLAMREGEVYVVTGPAFVGSTVKSLKGRVLVPTHVWKAVYAPRSGLAGAYLAPNDASGAWRRVGLAELRDLVGLDAFPLLPASAKAAAGPLPEPSQARKGGGGHAEAHSPSGLGGFIKRMLGFHR